MKKALLALAALSLLASCGGTSSSSQASSAATSEATSVVSSEATSAATSEASSETSSEETVTATISNKDELKAEWHVGDADRAVNLDLSPKCNILEALNDGTLTIVSSDVNVIGVFGRNLKALAEGTATITITYKGVTDSVELTILAMLGEKDYEVKTLTEIMAIEDGLVASGDNFLYGTAFITKVKVAVIGNKADGSASADKYGNMWVVEPEAEDGATPVQVYGSGASFAALSYQTDLSAYKYVNQKNFLDNEDTANIEVGDILDVVAIRADYKTTKEISFVIRAINGELIGNDMVTTDEVNATADSTNLRKQLVTVQGTITGWKDDATTDGTKYGNFFIQSEESKTDPVYVYGASASKTWEKTGDDGSVTEMDTIELLEDGSLKFNNPKDFLTNEATKDLKIGDKVSVMGFRCDYKGTIELTGIVQKYIEPAEEPEVVKASVADLLAKTAPESDKLYEITGVWENPNNNKYGGGYLTDPETGDSILVYGSTATATAFAFDGSTGVPVYTFTNPQDFLTNETTAALEAGDVVTVKAINAYYAAKSLPEINVVFTEIGEKTDKTFTASAEEAEHGTVELSKTEGLAYGEEVTVTVTPDEGYELDSLKIVDAYGNKKDIEDNTFAATCVNKVEATFKEVVENVTTVEYVISSFDAGTQYAENEAHVLDDNTTLTCTKCHFTTQLRIYSSETNNGFAIISSAAVITAVQFNLGNKADVLVVSASVDGTEFTDVAELTTTSDYADSEWVNMAESLGYKYLKLDVKGTNQVRVASFKLTYVVEADPVDAE